MIERERERKRERGTERGERTGIMKAKKENSLAAT